MGAAIGRRCIEPGVVGVGSADNVGRNRGEEVG